MAPNRERRAAWLLVAGVLVLALAFLVVSGVGVVSALVLIALVFVQAGAGALVWRWCRRGPIGAVEGIGMGLAIGTAMSVVSSLIVMVAGQGTWGWILPPLIVAIVWLLKALAQPSVFPERPPRKSSWLPGTLLAVLTSLVLGAVSLIVNVANYPLTWTGTWGKYHVDMLFFESLGTSLARLGPLDSIYTPDAVVRYHWLAYAWAGQLAHTAHAEPFVVLTRVLPFLTILATAFIGIAWTQRLTRVPWAPALTVALLIMGGFVGATYGAILNFDSPSMSMATIWLLGLSLCVVDLLNRDRGDSLGRSVGRYAGIGLLAFCLAGGKISSGAIAVAALAIVALIGLVRRMSWRWEAVAVALLTLAAFAAAYLLIVSGSADPGGLKLLKLLDRASSVQGLNPVSGSVGIVLGTVILMIAICVRWAGLVWLVTDRTTRWLPDTLLGIGLAIAGLGTVVLISGGLNDTWFALAASAPLAVLSAVGAARAARSIGAAGEGLWPARPVWWAAAAAAVLFVVVAVLWSTGASGGNVFTSTARWLGPLVGVVGAVIAGWILARHHTLEGSTRRRWLVMTVLVLVLLSAPGRALGVGSGEVGSQPGLSEDAFSPQHPFTQAIDNVTVTQWSDQHADAARWLRDHASATDLLATNITFSPFVPAVTGLRTLASGILYQAPYGRPGNIAPLLEREKQSWAFIDGPSAATAAPLCTAGVRWLWVDPTRTKQRDWAPIATVAFQNESAIILRLDPQACAA